MLNQKENKPDYLGHRQRLKDRYIKNGINSLAEHEILELILFYSIPRVDTKKKAYELLRHFGSLKNVVTAEFEALKSFGLTENTALHLRLFKDVPEWMSCKEFEGSRKMNYDDFGEFATKQLSGSPTEKLIAILIDSRECVIDVFTVCEGNFSESEVDLGAIAKMCVLRQAAKIILAHNHPSGKIAPSVADCITTENIDKFLSKLGVELVEHYIVAGNDYVGLKKMEEMARLAETSR